MGHAESRLGSVNGAAGKVRLRVDSVRTSEGSAGVGDGADGVSADW